MKGGNQGTKAGGASTTTGGKPNNANNKNNNNTQKTRIQNHIPAKVISAHQIYEAYVHEVIISGGYLDASQMYLALHDQVNLDRMEEYRNLCTLNKRVENAIYGYWQSCEIHIFDKLEKFVTVAVSRWKKLSPVPDNFEALGLGDLVRCPKVIELFQFPSNINRSRFSKATPLDLIRKVADMLTKLKFHKFDDISEHLTSIEVNNFRQQNICSFQMDAKTCFYICHNMKPNKLELVDIQKKVKEEYLVKKKEEFRNAITDVLVNDVARLNPTTMNEEYKSYVNDETEVENRNFMKIANSFVPFPTMFRKFYQTAFFEEESIRSTFDFDDALFLHQLSIIQKKDQNKDIIFKTEEICHVLIKVVAVWIHHFSSWKRSKEGQQSTNPIFAILQDKYLADIPAECLDRMVKWLQYVAEFCDDLEFTEDGVKKLPTSSVLDSIEVQIDEILTVSIEDENTFIDPKERTALHNQLKAAGLWSPELKNFKFTIDCPLCNKSTESIPQHFEQCHPNVMRKDFEAIIRYTYIEITEKRRKIYNGDYVELIEEICRETKAKRIPEKISDGLMTCPWCKASVVIESQSLVTHCKSSHPQVQSSVVDTVSKYGLWAIKRIDEATGKFDSMIYTVGDQIGIRITDLEPLITSAIVFYRKTILDKYCVNDQNIDIVLDNLFQRFPCIEQDVDTDNSMVPIMRTLCGIEKELKTELNIPAFECQGVGSFLSLISVPSRMKKLKTILEPFIGVKKESEEEFMKNNVVVATELSEQETNQMSQIIFEQLSALIDSLQSSSVDITLIAALAYLHNTVKSYLQQLTGKYISFLDHLPALLQPQSDLEVLFDRFLSFFQMNATDDVQHTEEKEETTATRQAMSLVSEVEVSQNSTH